ncbi:TPA: hypothetical protein DDW35_06020 [Candidatus Sumerlaeota bacterium]|jgi:hypothetical protein|nr:hypothetical protein [Candidatus Sumerlaeota bacterium]
MKQLRLRSVFCIAIFVLFSFALPAAFAADDIEVELKTGKKIHTSRVLFDGQKIKMIEQGAEVSKALDEIRRIEVLPTSASLPNKNAVPNSIGTKLEKELEESLAKSQKAEEATRKEVQELRDIMKQRGKPTYSIKENPTPRAIKSIRGEEMTRVTGSVVNDGSDPGKRVILEISAYDANNKVLSIAHTYVSAVQPGQVRPFLVDLDIPLAGIAHVVAIPIEAY